MWRVSAALVCALLFAVPPTQAIPQALFTFKAASRLVIFTVVVDGSHGPVGSLARRDFTVTDNGKRRAISVFEANRGASGGGARPPNLPPGEYSNTGRSAAESSANSAVILLDCLNTGPRGLAPHACSAGKQAAAKFLQQLKPGQNVALWGLNARRLSVLADFTDSRTSLLAALKRFRAYQAPAPMSPDDESTAAGAGRSFAELVKKAEEKDAFERHLSSARLTLTSLSEIANHLAQVPGRISLIWITVAPCIAGAKIAAALGSGRVAVYPIDARGLRAGGARIGGSAATAGDSFGRFLACSQGQGGLPGQADLLDIAAQTGGVAYLNRNDLSTGIQEAVKDSQASYTLGFYVGSRALDRKFHRLLVRVRGRGLRVRYPHGYWASDNRTSTSGLDPVAVAIHSPAEADGIPLMARVVSVNDKQVTLQGTVGLGSVALRPEGGLRRGELMFSLVGQNVAGAVVRQRSEGVKLKLTSKQFSQSLHTGLQFHQSLTLAPGVVTVRVVVEDMNTGNVGSLIIPLRPPH